MEVGPEEK